MSWQTEEQEIDEFDLDIRFSAQVVGPGEKPKAGLTNTACDNSACLVGTCYTECGGCPSCSDPNCDPTLYSHCC